MSLNSVVAALTGAVAEVTEYIRNKLFKKSSETICTEECQRLLEEINNVRKEEKFTFRFLVFGITKHGKSTLCNGLLSAYEGRQILADAFQSGTGVTSFTRGFCPFKFQDNLWLIDMGGIFESNAIDIENIRNVLEGRVPFYEQLGVNLERLDPKLDYPEPESNDLACVVIVMKPKTEITEQLRKKFQVVDDCAAKGLTSRCLVVTHIEETDPQFKDPRNLINIETSTKIRECRQRLSEETGIPLTSITFVRNYWDRRKTDVYTNYILLEFFNQLMQSGIDAKRRSANRKELSNMKREY